MRKSLKLLFVIILLLSGGCSKKPERIVKKADLSKMGEVRQIVQKEKAPPFSINKITTLDALKNQEHEFYGLDIQRSDLTLLDLKDVDLRNSTFDLQTRWPDKMPDDFDPQEVLETGKNPGLGIRKLHGQGITGKGVNVAIIDFELLSDHKEYKDRIQLYEKLNSYSDNASMHGAAVTSILAGNSVGVAPQADIYYINSEFDDCSSAKGPCDLNLNYMVEGIERVIEINNALPEDQKIKVVSISRGFSKEENPEVYEAIEKAKENGIFVVTVSLEQNYDIQLIGADKEYNTDPDLLSSYAIPAHMQMASYLDYFETSKIVFVPRAHRTMAGCLADDDYVHFSDGGASWSAPWLAGMYALCLQIDPDLTGDEFLEYVISSGEKADLSFLEFYVDNTNTVFINPEKLIETVRDNKK